MTPVLPSVGRRLWPVLFFGGLLVLGMIIAPDFGLYIDEFTNHYFGVVWYHYVQAIVVHHAPLAPLATATEHDVVHGPFFEMALAWIEESILHLTAIRPIVFFRHYATWLTFYGGVVCCYFLARRLFASRPLALLASLFLVLHPRIFSHAFYDSVDIPFLTFYTASIATLVRYFDRRTLGALALHAIVCALAIDIRSLAGVIPALTVVLLAFDRVPPRLTASAATATPPARRLLRPLGRIALFLAIVVLTTIVFWPFLWTNPLLRAVDVIQQTPKVNWNGLVLYLGREINAPQLPWHYLPVWILITTPIACSVFFFLGLFELVHALARHPVAFFRERRAEFIVLSAFLVPLAAVTLLRAVVYDAWRHLFFVYPAFVLIAVNGIRRTFAWFDTLPASRARLAKTVTAAALAFNLTLVAGFMVRSHPYENVYFNRLAGRDLTAIKQRFELDYWGLSYRRALEHLMATDPANPIRIYHSDNALLAINRQILPPAEQARIQQVEAFDEADYILTNFRQVRTGYPGLPEYFSIKVDGEKILSVYRRARQPADPSPPARAP